MPGSCEDPDPWSRGVAGSVVTHFAAGGRAEWVPTLLSWVVSEKSFLTCGVTRTPTDLKAPRALLGVYASLKTVVSLHLLGPQTPEHMCVLCSGQIYLLSFMASPHTPMTRTWALERQEKLLLLGYRHGVADGQAEMWVPFILGKQKGGYHLFFYESWKLDTDDFFIKRSFKEICPLICTAPHSVPTLERRAECPPRSQTPEGNGEIPKGYLTCCSHQTTALSEWGTPEQCSFLPEVVSMGGFFLTKYKYPKNAMLSL